MWYQIYGPSKILASTIGMFSIQTHRTKANGTLKYLNFSAHVRERVYEARLISKTIKVGGKYDNCVNISYSFDKDGIPMKALLGNILSEPECGLLESLEDGETVWMVKAALQFAHAQVPLLTKFYFEDGSRIDCKKSDGAGLPPRRLSMPLSLQYFYLAFYGQTWYEAKFGARMVDPALYRKYKATVGFLTDPGEKYPWIEFLRMTQLMEEADATLKSPYLSSSTYAEFFSKIPKSERCLALHGWIDTFMENWFGKVIQHAEWVIDLRAGYQPVPMRFGLPTGASQEGGSSTRRRRMRRHRPMREGGVAVY